MRLRMFQSYGRVLTAVLLFECLAGCGLPKRGISTEVIERGGLFYRKADGALYTGESRYYYKKERMTRVMNFKDGKLHGELSQKYDDGRMFGLAEYENGLKHGDVIKWHPNQQKMHHRVYSLGQLIRQQEWQEDGVQKKLLGWNADGTKKSAP